MNVQILRTPCIFYEIVELTGAIIQGISAEALTRDGPFCVPAEEVQRMMDAVTPVLPLSDRWLQRYFAPHPVKGDEMHMASLASWMVYSFLNLEHPDYDQFIESLCNFWERLRRRGFRVTGMTGYALEFEPSDDPPPVSLADALQDLPLKQECYMELLEVLSDYTFHLHHLGELLRPAAEILRPMLEPFVAGISPLAQAWEEFFTVHAIEDFARTRSGVTLAEQCKRVVLAFRFLDSRFAPGYLDRAGGTAWMHMGVSLPVQMQPPKKQSYLPDSDFSTFKLLGARTRTDMLRAMAKESLSFPQLSQQLNLNPGTVFRNLNIMTNAGLLMKEFVEGHYQYRTNPDVIRELLDNMMQYYKGD